ncbi:hypothetical protein NKH18_21510 [Streptomyces sp. M10(2022)]
MSKDPEAAATFLDPESASNTDGGREQDNDRLEYLTRERDWDVVDGHPYMRNPHDPDSMWGDPLRSSDIEDAQGRAGFGAALVAGTTGIDPNNSGGGYVEHSEANNRVFEGALKHLSVEGDEFLRASVRLWRRSWAITGTRCMPRQVRNSMRAAPGPSRGPGGIEADLTRPIRLLHAAGFHQPGNCARHQHGVGGPEETWRKAGHTVGFLEEARYQGLAVDADNAKSKAAWDAKMDYHTWGGVANFIPYGGTRRSGVSMS